MLPICTKEQAILLKEVGFNLPVKNFYYGDREGKGSDKVEYRENCRDFNLGLWSVSMCSAPTISEALLWLGDNKGFEFSNWGATRYKNDKSFEMINTFYTAVLKGNCSKCEKFDTYNSRLFQSKQLSMALEILNSEKPTKYIK